VSDTLDIGVRADGVRLTVHVKPRSSKSGITGVKQGALVVALRAPPVEGAANEELVEVLAKALGVRRGDVTLAAGSASKKKLVDVRGLGAAEVRARLGVS
jgi:uncharacterized protein